MSTFPFVPDQALTKSVKVNVNESTFGDGYSQRSSNGINTLGETLGLKFTVRTRAEINAIEAFLEIEKGVTSFYYTAPGSTAKRYTCDTWDANYMHDQNAELTCTFKRRFEP